VKTLRRRTIETALTVLVLAGGTTSAAWALDASPAVTALIRQGDFWSQKGRKDLAADAYRRALAADPSNAIAKKWLADLSAPSAVKAAAGGGAGNAGSGDLARARALAQQGQNAAAAAAYSQAFGGGAPPDAVALEYYQTLAGAPGGLAQAQSGLRSLAARKPGDPNVQLALGQALTYREGTRREGVTLLSGLAGRGGAAAARATTAWRQALIWMDEAPRNAGLFSDYLNARPGDAEIARKLAAANRPVKASAPAAAVDPSASDRADGFKALQGGDLAEAESRFQRALGRHANDADALGGLGLTRLRGQRFAEAADLLERAGRSSPGTASRWKEALTSARFYTGLQQAQTALDQGKAAQAEQALRPLTTSAYPDRAMAQGLLAEALRRQGKSTEAEALYRQVLATTPGQAEAQQGLVQVLLDQGRTAEADTVAGQSSALQLDASGQNVLRGRLDHDRANQLWANGDLSGANTAFESALAAAPADPWVRLDFARFLSNQGETKAAEGLMAQVAAGTTSEQIQAAAVFADQQGRPTEALALINRAPADRLTPEMAALKARLEIDAAIDQARQGAGTAYLKVIASRPSLSVDTQGRLAVALYELGDRQAALSLAQQALVGGVTEPPASYDGMVTVLARAGRDAEAAAIIRQAASRTGSTPQGARGVADLTATLGAERADRLRQAGDLASAFDVLSAAFGVAPKNTRLLAPLGRVYQSGRMYDEALQAYGALLRAKPDDKEGLIGVADASAAKGDMPAARRALSQALAASPRDADLYLLSARIERQAGDEAAALKALRMARALRQQPLMAGGGLDAVLAPGANGGAPSGGLGPNPFSASGFGRDAATFASIASSRYDLMSASSAPIPAVDGTASDGLMAGVLAPVAASGRTFAGVAFPITGRNGRAGEASAPRATTSVAPVAGNPFVAPAARDPMVGDIDRQIAELTSRTAAEVSGSAQIRTRSGEAGLSKLNELSAKASVATSIGGARFTATVAPVSIDAGTPSGSGEQRFGGNQILNARAIVGAYTPVYPSAGTQSAAGAAVNLAVKAGRVDIDIGATPIGFDGIEAVGGLAWSPRLGRHGQAKVWAERRPVTDSVVAYAGARDPVTGQRYGKVMRAGGGISLSYDDGDSGLYGDAAYSHYDGEHVRDNSGYQVNLGGYIRPYNQGGTQVQLGFNLNQQGFDNNQNVFSLGQGGYFSPKSFTSLTAPVSASGKLGGWTFKGTIAPGYQTYSQAGAAYFPMDVALQTELNALARSSTDVFARYLAQSSSGFGVAGGVSADYQFRPGTSIGGVVNFNTFGAYNETAVSVSVRQILGEETAK
jgi:tetratricopeptide (TPR) repeat protein